MVRLLLGRGRTPSTYLDAAGDALSAITGTLKATTGWVSPFRVSDPTSSSVMVCSTATAGFRHLSRGQAGVVALS
jgi:hypothetical protein